MDFSEEVKKKIEKYAPQGGLDHTAKLFLVLCGVNHSPVRGHMERVALLAEGVAKRMQKDTKAAFFGGLLHDVGKILLCASLFDGHNINAKEYAKVKTHAIAGFEALKEFHLFTAYCAGFHHALYDRGYGLESKDFPDDWNPATIKKVLDISTIVSICDFVDAFTTRGTKIRDGSDSEASNLIGMLEKKYPNDRMFIAAALKENEKIIRLASISEEK